MSMITRCPNCSTTFRVQPQQLQARNGTVRCGQCAHVFDGFKTLDTLADAPTPTAQPAVEPPVVAPAEQPPPAPQVTPPIEEPAAAAHALATVEERRAVREQHRRRDQDGQRQRDEQEETGECDVERPELEIDEALRRLPCEDGEALDERVTGPRLRNGHAVMLELLTTRRALPRSVAPRPTTRVQHIAEKRTGSYRKVPDVRLAE